jgi:hypothetical protein
MCGNFKKFIFRAFHISALSALKIKPLCALRVFVRNKKKVAYKDAKDTKVLILNASFLFVSLHVISSQVISKIAPLFLLIL